MSNESKPKTFMRLRGHKVTPNFREAVFIEEKEIYYPKEGEVSIRNKYVGINASDVNVTARIIPSEGGKESFGVGFEGVGEVVDVGKDVEHLKKGDKVAYMTTKVDSYAEYLCVSANQVYWIPEEKPEYLAFLVCGMAASLGLDKRAQIVAGEKVLITAAAGGVGHIAVQWAKSAGCHVIGTCSSEDKKQVLKELGCDRIINYKQENVAGVLAKEYENGVDVVWETLGGEMLETCLANLAQNGRIVIVGGISSYKSANAVSSKMDVPSIVLAKAASLLGFRRGCYRDCFSTYFKHLTQHFQEGKLKTIIDNGEKLTGSAFFGMEGIIRGVEVSAHSPPPPHTAGEIQGVAALPEVAGFPCSPLVVGRKVFSVSCTLKF